MAADEGRHRTLEQLLAACTAHELVLAATADAAHRAL